MAEPITGLLIGVCLGVFLLYMLIYLSVSVGRDWPRDGLRPRARFARSGATGVGNFLDDVTRELKRAGPPGGEAGQGDARWKAPASNLAVQTSRCHSLIRTATGSFRL